MTREELLQIAKPILFNTEMVRAILEDRKTVTRRICKDGNAYTVPDMGFFDPDKRTYAVHHYCDKSCTYEFKVSIAERKCPICPGDILYVRETWSEWTGGYVYRAWTEPFPQAGASVYIKWNPSIHMPKDAARIFLKVTDVRVERLQDITEEQAEKEGCQAGSHQYNGAIWGQEDTDEWTAVEAFQELWNSTIKKSDLEKYGWEANPWVLVIEFERIELGKG